MNLSLLHEKRITILILTFLWLISCSPHRTVVTINEESDTIAWKPDVSISDDAEQNDNAKVIVDNPKQEAKDIPDTSSTDAVQDSDSQNQDLSAKLQYPQDESNSKQMETSDHVTTLANLNNEEYANDTITSSKPINQKQNLPQELQSQQAVNQSNHETFEFQDFDPNTQSTETQIPVYYNTPLDKEKPLTSQEKEQILNQLYQKYQPILSKSNVKAPYPYSNDRNHAKTLNEALTEYHEKTIVQKVNGNNILYNPFGYRLEVPEEFTSDIGNPYLWKFHYLNKNVEIQYLLGVNRNSNINLEELLKSLEKKFSQDSQLRWNKVSSANPYRESYLTNHIESKTTRNLKDFYTIISIQVLSHKLATSVHAQDNVFIVSILSIHKGDESFPRLLEEKKKVFEKICYSFAFL